MGEGERLDVRKTYKLYIGGKFPRTESGRSYLVCDDKGRPWANACRASRKDVRDAVQAARKAVPGWSGATAYNRGQILYRVAPSDLATWSTNCSRRPSSISATRYRIWPRL